MSRDEPRSHLVTTPRQPSSQPDLGCLSAMPPPPGHTSSASRSPPDLPQISPDLPTPPGHTSSASRSRGRGRRASLQDMSPKCPRRLPEGASARHNGRRGAPQNVSAVSLSCGVEMQPRCSRGAAEVQPRCSRSSAEVQPRCSRGAAGVQPRCSQPRCSRGVAEVQPRGATLLRQPEVGQLDVPIN